MICARGKGKAKTLRLAARDAARRFTLRGEAKSRWLPLVLRWRQRRTTGNDRRYDRKSSRIQQLFSHNHFHFVTHASGFDRQSSLSTIFNSATVYRERVTFERGWTNRTSVYRSTGDRSARRSPGSPAFAPLSMHRERTTLNRTQTNVISAGPVSEPRHTERRSAINYPLGRALPGLIVHRSESLTRFRSVNPLTHRIRRDPRRSPALQDSPATRAARREELTRVSTIHRHTREYQTLPLSLRAPAAEPPASRGPLHHKSTRIFVDSPEELVWRRPQPSIASNNTDVQSNTSPAVLRQASNAAVEETLGQTVSPSINRAAPPAITKLDPAFVDRLTDDVIRRVEQRARIERQRRGL